MYERHRGVSSRFLVGIGTRGREGEGSESLVGLLDLSIVLLLIIQKGKGDMMKSV